MIRKIRENHTASRLRKVGEMDIMDPLCSGATTMKTMSAKAAKNAFGMMIDVARAELVTIEKHGRPVVIVMSVEEYERLNRLSSKTDKASKGVVRGG